MFSKASDDRVAESCYIGKKVYWTIGKGAKVQSGTIEKISGDSVTVKHDKGSSWLHVDEVWSTSKLAKKYPAL